jgi:hypothetical protein
VTINSRGHYIGQRDHLSNTDILTLTYMYGSRKYQSVVGDFDGDGIKNDVGLYSAAGFAGILKRSGDLYWNCIRRASTGYSKVFASDCNGDGRDDLMLVATNGWHKILFSDGYGFTEGTSFQIGTGYTSIIGDFDGDGLRDDFMAYTASGSIWALKTTGGVLSGTLLTGMPAGYNPGKLYAGDCNGDGRDDLLMIADNGWHTALFSTGAGFVGSTSFQIGTGFSSVLGDFNGDGRKADFVAYSGNGSFWLIVAAGGKYSGKLLTGGPAGYDPARLFAGDCNRDGRDDLMMVASNGWHLAMLSSGSAFSGSFSYQIGTGYKSIVGDFDGDGRANDFAAYASNGYAWLIKSTGSSFVAQRTQAPSIPAGYDPGRMFAIDMTDDGRDDLALWAENGYFTFLPSSGSFFLEHKPVLPSLNDYDEGYGSTPGYGYVPTAFGS